MWCFLGFSRPNVVFSKNLSGNCVVNVNKHGVGVCIDFFVSIFPIIVGLLLSDNFVMTYFVAQFILIV